MEVVFGNMLAIGVDGNIYILELYGMYVVELFDVFGNVLYILDGVIVKLWFFLFVNYSFVF